MTGSPPITATADGLRTARRQAGAAMHTATAGLRLIARDPVSMTAWTALWFAGLTAAALLVVLGGGVRESGGHATLGAQFGPYAVLIIAGFLLIWAATTVAVFRAALQPDRRGFFYLDLGADELRLAALTAVAFLVVLVLGGVPAYLIFAIASPILQAAPTLTRYVIFVGSAATIAFEIWVGVRLSLIAVETFAEGRFHLTAYWPLTRGRFWYLLLTYGICFLVFLGLGALLGAASALLAGVQSLIGWPHGADIGRRIALLALAGVYASVTSLVFVTTTVLFCGAQAHAFRAITGVSPRRGGAI